MCIGRTLIMKKFIAILVILNFHAYEAVRFFYEPTDHSAVEGKRVYFKCIFRDITDDMVRKYDVIWTKGPYTISEPSNRFNLDRFSFHNQYEDGIHSLRIYPVKREDGGRYRCHFRYNGDILLTSALGILTIREIPSNEYPTIKLGKTTYKTGEEVTIRCLCEKTNPLPELEFLRTGVLGLTTNPVENNSHVWIETIVLATLKLNDAFFECRMKVRDETAPRYSISGRLHIIDDSELFKTTSKEPFRETQQKYVKSSLSTDVLSATKAENHKIYAKGDIRIIGSGLTFGIIPTIISLFPLVYVLYTYVFKLEKEKDIKSKE